MLQRCLVMLLAGVLLLQFGCGRAAPAVPPPQTKLAPLTALDLNLGRVRCSPGTPLSQEWRFQCVSEVLSQLDAVSTCGCTEAKLSSLRPSQGECLSLTATFRFPREGAHAVAIKILDGTEVLAEVRIAVDIEFDEQLMILDSRPPADDLWKVVLAYSGEKPPAELNSEVHGGITIASEKISPAWIATGSPKATNGGRQLWIAEIELAAPSKRLWNREIVFKTGALAANVHP